MFLAYLDASALVKRYCPEPGSLTVDHLFLKVSPDRMFILSVGYAEVAFVLVRNRNTGILTPTRCRQAIADLRAEIGPVTPVNVLEATGDLSYTIRQGAVLGSGHPIELGKAFVRQVRAFADGKFADAYQKTIVSDPAYPALKSLGLRLTDWTGQIGPREDGFLSKAYKDIERGYSVT